VKEAQIKPRKAKEELRPFYTNFGTDQRAICPMNGEENTKSSDCHMKKEEG